MTWDCDEHTQTGVHVHGNTINQSLRGVTKGFLARYQNVIDRCKAVFFVLFTGLGTRHMS